VNEAQLRKRCAYWQKVLRLTDWNISVRVADDEELEQGGDCQVHQHSKLALIRVRGIETYSPTSGWRKAFPEQFDMEITLVHELLHIPFDRLIDTEDDEFAQLWEEQALEFLAQALVKLSRGE
jgi:hypothetical protein